MSSLGLHYQQLQTLISPYKAQRREPTGSFCLLSFTLSPPRSQHSTAVSSFEEVFCISAAGCTPGSDAAVDELVLVLRRELRCCLLVREASLFMEM